MKARLKSIVLSALGVMAAFSAVTYTSCNNDPCKAIICAYGGTCTEGDCICPSGYEGTHCEVVTRDKYEGVWTVFEDGSSTMAAQYEVKIIKGSGNTDMIISNFYNRFPGAQVNVRVKGDSLFIPQQTVDNYTIEGAGHLNWEEFYPDHGELTLYYKVVNPEGRTDDFGFSAGLPSIWTR
jgi:hypothetical protein